MYNRTQIYSYAELQAKRCTRLSALQDRRNRIVVHVLRRLRDRSRRCRRRRLVHRRQQHVLVERIDDVAGRIVVGNDEDLAGVRGGLADAEVLGGHPHHLREVAGIDVRVQQIGVLEVVVAAHRAVPVRRDLLAGQIGDQRADRTAEQVLAEVLLRPIVELVGLREMVGPLLRVLAQLRPE